ncbi:MAG: hypothetical protein JWO31_3838 [Phycisphaerales bacterium]|nr:hypothetical protein [Phycisphaerales bacterium]
MGSGSWSATDYHARVAAVAGGGGDAFAYSADAHRSGHLRPHQTLDPHGLRLRESRDNPDHPDSNAVIIGLDVTGSMGAVVRGIHADLPRLHELLLGHRYLPDPQILFAAVGDATCDRVPLQVGQFESDNRMDQNLENMVLEGGGGGQNTESYELTMYLAARHTATDCYEKRGRKGYLFMIGDELAYPAVSRAEVRRLIGDHAALEADVPLERIAAEAAERYHLFFLIPGGASGGRDPKVRAFWERLLGPGRVIAIDSPEDTSECIGLTIGLTEGVVDPTAAKAQMAGRGVVGRTIDRITGALAGLVTTGPTVKPPPGGRRL